MLPKGKYNFVRELESKKYIKSIIIIFDFFAELIFIFFINLNFSTISLFLNLLFLFFKVI